MADVWEQQEVDMSASERNDEISIDSFRDLPEEVLDKMVFFFHFIFQFFDSYLFFSMLFSTYFCFHQLFMHVSLLLLILR